MWSSTPSNKAAEPARPESVRSEGGATDHAVVSGAARVVGGLVHEELDDQSVARDAHRKMVAPGSRAPSLSGPPGDTVGRATPDTDRTARLQTRRPWWWRFVLVSPLVVLVAYFGADMWTGHRVNVAAARFDERYGGLSLRHVTTAPVPAANNRAHLVRAASALTVPISTAAMTALTSVSRTTDITPLPADLRAFAEANKPALGVLADARLRTQSSWEIEYMDLSNAPPWMDLRVLWQAAYVAALLKIEEGQPDEAAKYIASGLAMAASLRQEPNLIPQLLRIAIAVQQIDAIQHLITRAEPSKASLDEIARHLEENRSPDPILVGVLSDVRMTHAILRRMAKDRLEDGVPFPSPSAWRGPLARILRPYVRMAHASFLRHAEQLLDLRAGPKPMPPFPKFSRLPLVGALAGISIPGLERAIETGDDFNGTLGAAELAVALRRYRLDRGAYPDDLTPLVPAYLPAIPLNPFTARPPDYARQGGGFALSAPKRQVQARPAHPTPDWTVSR